MYQVTGRRSSISGGEAVRVTILEPGHVLVMESSGLQGVIEALGTWLEQGGQRWTPSGIYQ